MICGRLTHFSHLRQSAYTCISWTALAEDSGASNARPLRLSACKQQAQRGLFTTRLLKFQQVGLVATDSTFCRAGSEHKQQANGDGITYVVEWQVLTVPGLAADTSPRLSACRPRSPSWLLSVPGSEPQTMHVRGSSGDPAHATIASLGELQRAFARLGPSPVSNTRDAGSLTTLQLKTCGAVATTPSEPVPATRLSGRSQPGGHAALLGLSKVATLEMPSVVCTVLDLDSRAAHGSSARPPDGSSGGAGSDAHGTALRNGARLAPKLLPAPSGVSAHGRGPLSSLEGAASQPGKADTVMS